MIGDHLLLTFTIAETPEPPKIELKRNWKCYSKELLLQKLSNVNFDTNTDEVQTLWNHFESTILEIIDELIPYEPFINNQTIKSTHPSKNIKSKINLRKRLLNSH